METIIQFFERYHSHSREQCFRTTCSKTWQLQGWV